MMIMLYTEIAPGRISASQLFISPSVRVISR